MTRSMRLGTSNITWSAGEEGEVVIEINSFKIEVR
jgi:hypothetical protein